MRHTLTAALDDRGEAQHSLDRLLVAGYSHADAADAACQPGTEPGALQNHAHANSHCSGTRDSDDTFPIGSTFKASSSSDTNWADIGVGATDAGPSVEQDMAGQRGIDGSAASLGYQRRYRHWRAAAADLKANWTLRHPGELPPWEKFKDAVLHGWGRIKLGSD